LKSSTAPRTKVARQAAVADILARQPVRSQRELTRALAGRGIAVTQATVSRDLDELGAAKMRRPGGGSAYAVPGDDDVTPAAPGAAAAELLARRCAELLVDADGTAHLAVLHTPPGGAHLLASALDQAGLTGVLGCVAGDDTVIVVCRSTGGGPLLARDLRERAQPARKGTDDQLTARRRPGGTAGTSSRRTDSGAGRSRRRTGGVRNERN
jgi:transcriptional regulator of arginine metabolism